MKALLNGYGKYLLVLGGATACFLAGFYTYHLMVLLPVLERYQ